MLETSAVHQTPQAKNIPYQPLLIKPIFMRYVFHPKLLLQSYKHVHVTFSVTEKGLPSPTVREAGEKGKKPQQSSEVCCSESSQSEKSSAWNDLQKATWNGDAQAVRRLLCGGQMYRPRIVMDGQRYTELRIKATRGLWKFFFRYSGATRGRVVIIE